MQLLFSRTEARKKPEPFCLPSLVDMIKTRAHFTWHTYTSMWDVNKIWRRGRFQLFRLSQKRIRMSHYHMLLSMLCFLSALDAAAAAAACISHRGISTQAIKAAYRATWLPFWSSLSHEVTAMGPRTPWECSLFPVKGNQCESCGTSLRWFLTSPSKLPSTIIPTASRASCVLCKLLLPRLATSFAHTL